MGSLTFEAYQAGFYQQTYHDIDARTKELKTKFDPMGKGLDVWVTKDNNVIPVPFMTVSHIRNAYRYLMRKVSGVSTVEVIKSTRLNAAAIMHNIDQLKMLRKELKRRKLSCPAWDADLDMLRRRAHERAAGRIGQARELFGARRDAWMWADGHPDDYGDKW